MNRTSQATNKKIVSELPISSIDNNITYYQIFYISLISLFLIVNVLFQQGTTDSIIKRAWGINNISYFPWWVQVFVFVLLFSFAIPSVNNAFRLFIQKQIERTDNKNIQKLKKITWFIGVSLLISGLFCLFRVKYDLLGDMNLRVSQSVEGKYIDDEYFTMYFLHYINIVLQKLFHFLPHRTFVVHSIVGGFFFSFFGLLIADLLFDDLRRFIAFFLFYITIGTVLVFCGYVEIYAFPAASASLYMYTALLFLKKKVSIIIPFLCMVLAVALHKEQISVLPSFIFIATRKIKFVSKIDIKTILILFLISIPLIYLLNSVLHLQELMPLAKDKDFPYLNKLYSFSYLWELFNSQYISSGILIFLFLLILFKSLKGQIQLDEYSKFFLIATLFIYSIVFTMNKMRGSGDWDVCSFPAIYLSMFVGYTALSQWKNIYSPVKIFYILSTALLLNTVDCCAWVGLNSGKKSMDKIEDMLLTDPGWYYQVKLPSVMELSILFQLYGSHDKAMQYYKLSYNKYGSTVPAAVTNYVAILMKDNDTNQAVPVMENTVSTHPVFFQGYTFLFQVYERRKQYQKIYNMAKLYLAIYDTNPKSILEDKDGKEFLTRCVIYLYGASLARHDNLTHQDALLKMQQLHISVTSKHK